MIFENCPFCNSYDLEMVDIQVYCRSCGCRGPSPNSVETWNSRAANDERDEYVEILERENREISREKLDLEDDIEKLESRIYKLEEENKKLKLAIKGDKKCPVSFTMSDLTSAESLEDVLRRASQ